MTWNQFRCPECLGTFGGASVAKAIDRFLTHPKHDCVIDAIAGNRTPYNRSGMKR